MTVRPDWKGDRQEDGGSPLYCRVYRELERLVLESDLGEEGLLPPEPRLMEQFGVSRGTLRRATAELVRSGLLRSEPGRGTFVNHVARARRLIWGDMLPVMRPDSRFHLGAGTFIPDFEGSEDAIQSLLLLPEYQSAGTILATPDNCLEGFRFRALEDGKTLLVPTFGLRRGFTKLAPATMPPGDFKWASTLDGMERAGRQLKPADMRELERVDLLVTGAVAVTRDGTHIGGGQAFLDLEWAALRSLELTVPETPVLAVVHDRQVLDVRIPRDEHQCHLSRVITPTEVLTCPPAAQPPGILWERLGLNYGMDNPSLRELLGLLRAEVQT